MKTLNLTALAVILLAAASIQDARAADPGRHHRQVRQSGCIMLKSTAAAPVPIQYRLPFCMKH